MNKKITRAVVATALAGAAAAGTLAFAGTATAAAERSCSGLNTPGSDCAYDHLGGVSDNIAHLDDETSNPSDRTIKSDIAEVRWSR
ncbi:hypothetical protein [Streptomyces sp. NBC_00503]|uniref:hypothetical protein n=1 Tax=Streptomyces sp. NBC_00503 TaxID=2903659 RepID=UPI002E811CB9|nr:hypothetical protein [Streptomyces sp. NBC_00503]WUD85691.1 hypothetical protein OG490_36915 [Streptomyces sp. NBC_00503]